MWDAKKMFPNLDWYSRGQLPHDGRAHRDVHAAVRDLRAPPAGRRTSSSSGSTARSSARRANYIGPEDRQFVPLARAQVSASASRCPSTHRLRRTRRPCPPPSPTSVPSPTRSWSTSPTTSRTTRSRATKPTRPRATACSTRWAAASRRWPIPPAPSSWARSCPAPSCPNGAKVPGTPFQLDPVQAAFNIGAMIRWLDFNDTWLAAEWGHPSDNLGGILATADWLSRNAVAAGKRAADRCATC